MLLLPAERVPGHRLEGLGVSQQLGACRCPPRSFHGSLEQGPGLGIHPQPHLDPVRAGPADAGLRPALVLGAALAPAGLHYPSLEHPHRKLGRCLKPLGLGFGGRHPGHLPHPRVAQLPVQRSLLDTRQLSQCLSDPHSLARRPDAQSEQNARRMIDVRIASQYGEWRLRNAVGQIGEVAADYPFGVALAFEQTAELDNQLLGVQAGAIIIMATTHDGA